MTVSIPIKVAPFMFKFKFVPIEANFKFVFVPIVANFEFVFVFVPIVAEFKLNPIIVGFNLLTELLGSLSSY